MEYKIRISETCLEQIRNTLFPRIYPEISKKDKAKRNYRKIVINNYVILYTFIEEGNIVFISDFYYVRQNYLKY